MTKKTATAKAEIEKLLQQLARAQEAIERGRYQDARKLFETVRHAAGRAGIRSGNVAWGLAIACDYLGDLEEAMQYIREARDLDPLASPFNRSFDIISQHIRDELLRPDRAADDANTPLLYQLLVQAGATGAEAVHLVQTRYLVATGKRDAALKLIEAVNTLFPSSSEAWALRAEIAIATGDHETAAMARAEAAALGDGPILFAAPGQAQG
jgi:tetratricopeptide (TPR) repeat protein